MTREEQNECPCCGAAFPEEARDVVITEIRRRTSEDALCMACRLRRRERGAPEVGG